LADALRKVLKITASVSDGAVGEKGFNVPMFACHHTLSTARVITISDPDALLAAPYSLTPASPNYHVYLGASAFFRGRDTKISTLKIGRRAGAATQIYSLTPSAPSVAGGDVYSFKINGITVSYTSAASDTVAIVCTALAAIAVTGYTLAVSSGKVTVTSTVPGRRQDITEKTSNLAKKETTVEPATTLAQDLSAIYDVDKDWTVFSIDSAGAAEVLAAEAWCATHETALVATVSDDEIIDPAITTDIGSASKAASYANSMLIYHEAPYTEWAAATWIGECVSDEPGTVNWAHKTLQGVTVSNLTDTAMDTLISNTGTAKNVNFYVDIGGSGSTFDARSPSWRYFDITMSLYWLLAQLRQDMLSILKSTRRIPYDESGRSLLESVCWNVIERAQRPTRNIISTELDENGKRTWGVSLPALSEISSVTRRNRVFPDIQLWGIISGAVNSMEMKLSLAVAQSISAQES